MKDFLNNEKNYRRNNKTTMSIFPLPYQNSRIQAKNPTIHTPPCTAQREKERAQPNMP